MDNTHKVDKQAKNDNNEFSAPKVHGKTLNAFLKRIKRTNFHTNGQVCYCMRENTRVVF